VSEGLRENVEKVRKVCKAGQVLNDVGNSSVEESRKEKEEVS